MFWTGKSQIRLGKKLVFLSWVTKRSFQNSWSTRKYTKRWVQTNCFTHLLTHVPKRLKACKSSKPLTDLQCIDRRRIKKCGFSRNIGERLSVPPEDRQGIWVGLNDLAAEGRWRWLDGSAATDGEIRWHTGQPNSYGGNQDCANLWGSWSGYRMDDGTCSGALSAICEIPPYQWRSLFAMNALQTFFCCT